MTSDFAIGARPERAAMAAMRDRAPYDIFVVFFEDDLLNYRTSTTINL